MRARPVTVALLDEHGRCQRHAPMAALAHLPADALRPRDAAWAARWFRRVARTTPPTLELSDRRAEDLLAACDVVALALARVPETPEDAPMREAFRTFRCALHMTCSGAPELETLKEAA